MVGEKNKNHTKTLSSFVILQENLSYKENLLILFEFASLHICLREITENLKTIFFPCLIIDSCNLILTIVVESYRWISAFNKLEIAIKSGLSVTIICTSG